MLTRAVNAFRKRRPKQSAKESDQDSTRAASETETETDDCASCRSEPIDRFRSKDSSSGVAKNPTDELPGADGGRERKRFHHFASTSASASSLLRLRSRSRSNEVFTNSTISRKACVNCGNVVGNGETKRSAADRKMKGRNCDSAEKPRHHRRDRRLDATDRRSPVDGGGDDMSNCCCNASSGVANRTGVNGL